MLNHPISLEEISRLGRGFYFEELKDRLEHSYFGQYVVIDVELKKYKINLDRLAAIEEAKKEFGDKLFYIVQIGEIQTPNSNFSEKYAWNI